MMDWKHLLRIKKIFGYVVKKLELKEVNIQRGQTYALNSFVVDNERTLISFRCFADTRAEVFSQIEEQCFDTFKAPGEAVKKADKALCLVPHEFQITVNSRVKIKKHEGKSFRPSQNTFAGLKTITVKTAKVIYNKENNGIFYIVRKSVLEKNVTRLQLMLEGTVDTSVQIEKMPHSTSHMPFRQALELFGITAEDFIKSENTITDIL
uniref:Ribosome assembly factor SBDS n=1 Tax=Strongyloides papillosus TaxID=174720 RepID=A0A0N5BP67_STREA